MKNRTVFILIIVISVISLINISCSNDLDILAPGDPEPIVYCVIDPSDSVYKIILSKTFSGHLSASQMAQDTNYLYYKNAQVSMECWGSGYLVWKTDFHPTSATRDSGLFSSLPGYSYETENVLSTFFGNRTENISELGVDYLRLVINSPELKEPAYARISLNFDKQILKWPLNTNKNFNLCDTIPYYIKFKQRIPGRYYELKCKFRYIEFTNSQQLRSIDFIINKDILVIPGVIKTFIISPDVFFRRLAACFPPDTVLIDYRKPTTVDIALYVGSENYKQYIDAYYIDNDHGYTLWNCFHAGIGLFALKDKTVLTDLEMNQQTKDSLAYGMYTKQLKFTKW